MLRRWRRITSRRRAKRLKMKQQPMTPSSSPVGEASSQECCPDSTTTTTQQEHHHRQQPERDEDLERGSLDCQVTRAAAELEGLSLRIDNFTRGKGEIIVEAGTNKEENRDQPASPLDGPEEGSQTSGDESCASFLFSGSSSTDHSSSADDDEAEEAEDAEEEEGECAPETVDAGGPLPSPETTFKLYRFHEEFREYEMEGDEDDEEEDEDPQHSPTGPWSSSAVPRWAFLRSSNSLPVLNLGPGDFYHGGSALKNEVSADEGEGEDEEVESRGSLEIATVAVVHL